MILAIVVWVFRVAAAIAIAGQFGAVLFSQGLLLAYAFSAVNRVSAGQSTTYMPDIGDISDLIAPLRLGAAAFVVSVGPLLLTAFLSAASLPATMNMTGDVARGDAAMYAEETEASPAPDSEAEDVASSPPTDESFDDSRTPPNDAADGGALFDASEAPVPASGPVLLLIMGVLAATLLWAIVYSPIALTVAAISHSMFDTLNPIVGIRSIRAMGSVYWQAMLIYLAISVPQFIADRTLALIPFVGGLVASFVDCYAWLSLGCALGIAVFKKAPELGLE